MLDRRNRRLWSRGCTETATIRGIILTKRNLLGTLVALSPHIEHVPFMLPVPGPVVVVVIGDVVDPPRPTLLAFIASFYS